MTDIRQLRQFIAVAEDCIFDVQPSGPHDATSASRRQCRALRRLLRWRLFHRSKEKGDVDAGRGRGYSSMHGAASRFSDLRGWSRPAADGQTGRLRLAFASTVAL